MAYKVIGTQAGHNKENMIVQERHYKASIGLGVSNMPINPQFSEGRDNYAIFKKNMIVQKRHYKASGRFQHAH
jgi:hypothetical protein